MRKVELASILICLGFKKKKVGLFCFVLFLHRAVLRLILKSGNYLEEKKKLVFAMKITGLILQNNCLWCEFSCEFQNKLVLEKKKKKEIEYILINSFISRN